MTNADAQKADAPQKSLNPGSPEAKVAGCLCPVIDNGRGRGYMGIPGVYVMREDCPMHGREAREVTVA